MQFVTTGRQSKTFSRAGQADRKRFHGLVAKKTQKLQSHLVVQYFWSLCGREKTHEAKNCSGTKMGVT